MTPQRIQAKLFLTAESTVDWAAIIPLFHRWIQQDAVDGLLIDVADYRHVPQGSRVMLVGHEVDYALDDGFGRNGLLHTRKLKRTQQPASLAVELQQLIRSTLSAANLLQAAPELNLTFALEALELRFVDQLETPNVAETFDQLKPLIIDVLGDEFGKVSAEYIERDARRPLAVQITLSPELA